MIFIACKLKPGLFYLYYTEVILVIILTFLLLFPQQFSSARNYEHTQISVEEDATTDDQGERLQRYVGEGAGYQAGTYCTERYVFFF